MASMEIGLACAARTFSLLKAAMLVVKSFKFAILFQETFKHLNSGKECTIFSMLRSSTALLESESNSSPCVSLSLTSVMRLKSRYNSLRLAGKCSITYIICCVP